MNEIACTKMRDALSFVSRMTKTAKRCMSAVLEGKPKCHFGSLHGLAMAIEATGNNGSIYVSDLSQTLYGSPQAVSRCLRILEQDGLIERCMDPNDRRKTLVRLTPEGQQAHDACETAMQEYGTAVAARLGAERLRRMQEDLEALIAAMEAEAENHSTTGEAYV